MHGQGRADVGIVTALEVERDAVLRALGGADEPDTVERDSFAYHLARLPTRDPAIGYSVVVVLSEEGNLNAALATRQLITHWRPRWVIMVGIAGGVAGKVRLGDVVVAKFVQYYEGAKVYPDRVQARPRQFVP